MNFDLFITLGIILVAVVYLVMHLRKKKGCGCGCSCGAPNDTDCAHRLSKTSCSCENTQKDLKHL